MPYCKAGLSPPPGVLACPALPAAWLRVSQCPQPWVPAEAPVPLSEPGSTRLPALPAQSSCVLAPHRVPCCPLLSPSRPQEAAPVSTAASLLPEGTVSGAHFHVSGTSAADLTTVAPVSCTQWPRGERPPAGVKEEDRWFCPASALPAAPGSPVCKGLSHGGNSSGCSCPRRSRAGPSAGGAGVSGEGLHPPAPAPAPSARDEGTPTALAQLTRGLRELQLDVFSPRSSVWMFQF